MILFLFTSCPKDPPPIDDEEDTGGIILKFAHYVDGKPLQKDTMIYIDSAGNPYEVNEIKYFISDVRLHKSGGSILSVNACKEIFFVNNDISSTLTWNICDKFPTGTYDSVSFRFGIISAKNQSHIFVNPPEVDMEWPAILGGGYHYMMLNGKWKDSINQIENFNTHLGIGRVISGNDTTYIDNSFHVKLANSGFTLSKDATREIQIIMNIESWYKTPYIYDHNYYGQMIMQNQNAMHIIASNGVDVFTVGYIH